MSELTITYNQIRVATATLRTLLYKPLTNMRGADSLKLARMYKALADETVLFQDQHKALIVKHGGVEVNGVLTVPEEKIAEFSPEYIEMAETTVDLPFGKLPAAVLDNSGLAIGDMLAVEFLFED